jgi:hypothetical protein
VRQLAINHTQKNKQRNLHASVSVCVSVHEDRERISVTLVTSAAQGCPSDLCMLVSRACVLVLFRKSLYCACLSAGAHRDTKTHTRITKHRKTQANTCQVMIENQHFHSSTASQYSATHQSFESPAKTPGGTVDNWLLDKSRFLYRGETES